MSEPIKLGTTPSLPAATPLTPPQPCRCEELAIRIKHLEDLLAERHGDSRFLNPPIHDRPQS